MTKLVSIAISLVAASTLFTRQSGQPNYGLHDELLKQAKGQMQKGFYKQAALSAKAADDLMAGSPGQKSIPARLVMCEAEIHQEHYKQAYEIIAGFWRPGREVRAELLMAIAESFVPKKENYDRFNQGIVNRVERWPSTIIERIGGDRKQLPNMAMGENAIGARALLLYASDPSLSPIESLDLALKADGLVPENQVAAYLIGNDYLNLGKYNLAKPRLAYAVSHSTGPLLKMSQNASAKCEEALAGNRG